MIINVCSPSFNVADSYGRIASELARHLSALARVNCLSLDSSHTGIIYPAMGGILLGYPTLHERFGGMVNGGAKIAITMFESTQLPEGWAEELNKCDAVIIPSTWLIEVFRRAGVTAPLHVVPLGISDEFLKYTSRPNIVPSKDTPFIFAGIADRGRRKGWVEAVSAFVRAFGENTDYRLVLKARSFPLQFSNPNIQVLACDMSNSQLAELYTQAHVMVFPARAEGYGLPPREFAGTGGLSLVTNWGGLADDLHQWALPIPALTEPAWCDDEKWYGKLGEWAIADVDSLSALMKHVAEHYASYQDFRVRSAGYMLTQRWGVFAHRVFAIWRKVLEDKYGRDNNRKTEPA